MPGFDREILERQIGEVFGQLVSNCMLNVQFPVSTNTDPWAEFFFGNPDQCRENWAVPFVFLHDLDYTESFGDLCTDKMTVNGVIGVEADCSNIKGQEQTFEDLWYKVRRFFGRNAGAWTCTGTYTLTNFDSSVQTFANPKLSDFGIRRPSVLGNTRLSLDNGRAVRYMAQLTMTMYFNSIIPTI